MGYASSRSQTMTYYRRAAIGGKGGGKYAADLKGGKIYRAGNAMGTEKNEEETSLDQSASGHGTEGRLCNRVSKKGG